MDLARETDVGTPLDEVLSVERAVAVRRLLLRRLGELVRRRAGAGVTDARFHAWSVIVHADHTLSLRDDGGSRGRGRRPRPVVRRLAELFATLPLRSLSSTERWRLLGTVEANHVRRRPLLVRVQRWCRRWQRAGVLPRGTWQEAVDGPERTPDPAWRDVRAGTDWFDPPGVQRVRERDGRRNLTWITPEGETWYGKLYLGGDGHRVAPAVREARAHRLLDWLGVPVPEVQVVAERSDGASVLWTRGLRPGLTLRDVLHAERAGDRRFRREALREVAAMVRRLHRAGFCHRDLYLDHFLLHQRDDAGTGGLADRAADGSTSRRASPRRSGRWVLIDLARVERRQRLSRRAQVRDLARLEYSARTCEVPRTERLRAFRVYLGGAIDHALARSVLRRADRIERRERRYGRFPVPVPW